MHVADKQQATNTVIREQPHYKQQIKGIISGVNLIHVCVQYHLQYFEMNITDSWRYIPLSKKIMPWKNKTFNSHKKWLCSNKCCIYNLENPVEKKNTGYLWWYLTEVCLPNMGRGLRREGIGDSILHSLPSQTCSCKLVFVRVFVKRTWWGFQHRSGVLRQSWSDNV